MSTITPQKIFYDMETRSLLLASGSPINRDDLYPGITVGQKDNLVNIQLVDGDIDTPYTKLPSDCLGQWLTDNDYSNPTFTDFALGSSNWTESGSGTGEYYYNTQIAEPESVFADNLALEVGTLGALTAGQFAFGDNDTIGANRVYVRLADSSDPDTKDDGYLQYIVDSSYTKLFLQSLADNFNTTDSWQDDDGSMISPDITEGEISFIISANTVEFSERLGTSSAASGTWTEVQLIQGGTTNVFENIKFTFRCLNRLLPNALHLDSSALAYYTKTETLSLINNLLLFGSGEPGSELGINGCVYYDEDDFDIYKKESGSWVLKGNLTGASITSAAFVGNDLVFTKDDATTVTLTNAKVTLKGDTGAKITSAAFNVNDIDFTLDDASVVTLTDAKITLKGDTGDTGETGETGATGASITSAAFVGDDIVYTKDDTNTVTLTDAAITLKGDQGIQGETGETGATGAQGDSSYTYIAYASDSSGTDFTETFNSALDYYAFLTTDTEIVTRQASDFTGLWKNVRGADGVIGIDSGIRFAFDSSTTTNEDPGTGDLRFNNATLGSVTELAISYSSAISGNPSVETYVKTWDDSDSTNKGQLIIKKASAAENFVIYTITSAITDGTTYGRFTLEYVASSGSFSNADELSLNFNPSGDKGEAGDTIAPATNTDNYVPQWDGADSKTLKNGLATGNASGAIVLRADTNDIAADAIDEITGDAGVTIDGLTIKDAGLALGSDADGDIYYRASGSLARLGKGTAAQVLTMNTEATAPEWAEPQGGSGSGDPFEMQAILY